MSADLKFLVATFTMSLVVFFGGMWIGWAMRGDVPDRTVYDEGYEAGWGEALHATGWLSYREDA